MEPEAPAMVVPLDPCCSSRRPPLVPLPALMKKEQLLQRMPQSEGIDTQIACEGLLVQLTYCLQVLVQYGSPHCGAKLLPLSLSLPLPLP